MISHRPEARERAVEWPLVAVGVLGLTRIGIGLALGFRPFDDTFITFRYALNISQGNGFVYNLGEYVLGTTTPLWTMVLGAAAFAGAGLQTTAVAISLLCDLVTALLLLDLLVRLGFSRTTAIWSALLFLANFDFLSLARSGMETSVFVALVVAALNGVARNSWSWAAVAGALAALTRPEGTIVIPIILLGMYLNRRTLGWKGLLAPASILVAVLGTWAAYATWRFGGVVPQSIVAKATENTLFAEFSRRNLALFFYSGQYGDQIFQRTLLQLNFVVAALTVVATVDLVLDLRRSYSIKSARRVVVLLSFPALYIAGLAASHAFTWFPWYYGPVYPFMGALALIGADVLGRRLTETRRRGAVTSVGAVLLAAQIIAAVAVKLPNDTGFWVEGYLAASADIPRDRRTRVAALEIGAVGWQTWPAEIIDLVGLVTPAAVGRSPVSLLREESIDYVVVRSDDESTILNGEEEQPAWSAMYDLVVAVPHPDGVRQFRTYLRRR